MVDAVLLLVDAVDGPMPQTRFVARKALLHGLQPIVVINKIDRPGARPEKVIEDVFELFVHLGATDEQLDFKVIYASALQGYAYLSTEAPSKDLTPLFTTLIDTVKPPKVDLEGPFQMQITSLDYSSYVGTIGIGRIQRGTLQPNTAVTVIDRSGVTRQGRIAKILGYRGLERQEVTRAHAGDIIAVTGIEGLSISDTLCDPQQVDALPPLSVDEPTLSMTFQVNDSPLAGRDGKLVTSRQILERLEKELIHNVALRVEPAADANKFRVSGRGELHLAILIETMRREGYELGVSCPEVILKEVEGELQEPYELLTLELEESHQGAVIEKLGTRKGEMVTMTSDEKGRVRLEYKIPTRALIGFHTDFLAMTAGQGVMYHSFDHYGPATKG
jgi:GTP-binding protein